MNGFEIWTIIIAIGAGSFLLRFSFLGLIGDRPMPAWLLRHLRYTAVAILPALVAPLVVWPQGAESAPDYNQMIAAAAALIAGVITRNIFISIIAGAGVLTILLLLT